MELDGRVAIVIGAARGIGAETAALLAARGASVVCSERAAFVTGAELVVDGGTTVGDAGD
jgi:short-subunit dehydrogenase